ncbi:ARM repeat-containing protein [Nemania sp. FL0916]|nr:ARM repeat-containing protein [Nemania sp. FL0916]
MGSDNRSQFSSRPTTGIRLCQVYPPSESDDATNVDIIALHGLDTDSSRTWTHKDKEGKKERGDVNWLKDPDMLPHRIPNARIFTCDWPADMIKEKDTIQMTIIELARRLLRSLQDQLITKKKRDHPSHPILFIASCLGGIILAQAMIVAESEIEFNSLWKATGGIVFLATPFRETSFRGIASVVVWFLIIQARFTNTAVTNLLDSVKEPGFLQELVGKFTQICQQRFQYQPCQLAIFYEMRGSNLMQKGLPSWIANYFNQPKVLVSSDSARLDIVPNPIALDRPHVTMNKFFGPDDADYNAVSGQIQTMVSNMLETTPINQAKLWIRYNYQFLKKLDIERLSGVLVPMDQCYINLAIVKQSRDESDLEMRSPLSYSGSPFSFLERLETASPFSFVARLQGEASREEDTIKLPALFEPCGTRYGRIMVRGRAGAGKTTLCKKIVYEFTYGNLWRNKFDFVLWVPLRKLKLQERCAIPGYNLRHLLRHEFFSQSRQCKQLANALWHAIDTESINVLFILDGLDEVLSSVEGGMREFLYTLLNQPNVIVTSRPNMTFPAHIKPFHLELETVGFYWDQVNAYIKNVFTNYETNQTDDTTIAAVRSFINHHQLIKTLVRIPIQLDAFCFTWNNSRNTPSSTEDTRETMTGIYQGIERSLWGKDAERLEKSSSSKMLNASDGDIRRLTENEHYLLEYLAFNGMYSDLIVFEPSHREIFKEHAPTAHNNMFFDEMLGRVSFLRSSDPSPDNRYRNYHFLHLTFQQYFAAQYFVRQWRAGKPLTCLLLSNGDKKEMSTSEFLYRNKYNSRYDIFWRFVAGLLCNSTKETVQFFQTIENESRDLLGLTHQRLIIRCLSEVSGHMPPREHLEDQNYEFSSLAGEVERWSELETRIFRELPGLDSDLKVIRPSDEYNEMCLEKSGSQADHHFWALIWQLERILRSRTIEDSHFPAIIACFKDEDPDIRSDALRVFQTQQISEKYIPAIIVHVDDQDWMPRLAALEVFHTHQITEKHFPVIIARIEDQHRLVRAAARRALQSQLNAGNYLLTIIKHEKEGTARMEALGSLMKMAHLPEDVLQSIAKCLEDESILISTEAMRLLHGRPHLPKCVIRALMAYMEDKNTRDKPHLSEDVLRSISACLKDEHSWVRMTAAEALRNTPYLPEDVLQALVICFEDAYELVRFYAIQALRNRLDLPESVLRDIASFLKSENKDVIQAASEILITRKSLHLIANQHVKYLYQALLEQNGVSYITLENEEISEKLPDDFTLAVREAQRQYGIPRHPSMQLNSALKTTKRPFHEDSADTVSSQSVQRRLD